MTKPSWELDEEAYNEIDPILDRWANRNAVKWAKTDRGYTVRSYSVGLVGSENLQIWINPPENAAATVCVALNSASDMRRKVQRETYPFDQLEAGLDNALGIFHEWKKTYEPQ